MMKTFTLILIFIFYLSLFIQPCQAATETSMPNPGNQDAASLNEIKGRLNAVNQVLRSYRGSTNAKIEDLQAQIDYQDTLLDSFFRTADLSVVKEQQVAEAAKRAELLAKIKKLDKKFLEQKKKLEEYQEGDSNILVFILFLVAIGLALVLYFRLKGSISSKTKKISEDAEKLMEELTADGQKSIKDMESKSMEFNQVAEDMVMRAKIKMEEEINQVKADLQKQIAEFKKK